MKKLLTAIFFLAFALNVTALEVSSLKPQATLVQCEQVTFPFQVDADGPVEFQVTGMPAGIEYAVPPARNVRSTSVAEVTLYAPCDAVLTPGNYAVTLTALQGGDRAAATSYLYISPVQHSVQITIVRTDNVSCACGSTRFNVALRNAGKVKETGAVLVSSSFDYSVSDTAFDLAPGQSTTKVVTLDLNCSSQPGVHPFSVGVLFKGGGVSYSHSGVNVVQCYASQLTGIQRFTACQGDTVILPFVIYNNGIYNQTFSFQSELGSVSPRSVSIAPHSNYALTATIAPYNTPLAGVHKFNITSNNGFETRTVPVELTTTLCPERQFPTLVLVEFPAIENNTLYLQPGNNFVMLNVSSGYSVEVQNAALYLDDQPISDAFTIPANGNIEVPVVINMADNFTNATTATLKLASNQGIKTQTVTLARGPSALSGLFVFGFFLDNVYLGALMLVIIVLLILFYWAYDQHQNRVLIDKKISKELKQTLARHSRR